MCMSTTGTSSAAASPAMSGSNRRALMSFTMSAPSSSARRATSAL